jgi:hypothetical protein
MSLRLAVRDTYSKHPGHRALEPWEIQQVLWSLG